jgi:uncharacterized protein (TIRG00374 family)
VRRRTQLLFGLLGTALLVGLVARMGLSRLWSNATTTGWRIVPIVLLYGLVLACSAQAWRLIIGDDPRRPAFARAYANLVSGTALNFITPLVNVGGEPYRIASLAPQLGIQRATGSVILHTMLRVLSFLLVWLSALVLALAILPRSPFKIVLLGIGFPLVVALMGFLLIGHRDGVLERLLDAPRRVPGLRRLARRFEPRRAALRALDAQITEFWQRHRRRFAQALALEYLSRCIFMVEFCLIGASIGVRVSYIHAFIIGGLEALVTNLLFFVPFELGTRESAMYLLFQQLGYAPEVGLYAALVSRLRDLIWIAAGVALVWVGRPRRPSAAPVQDSVST